MTLYIDQFDRSSQTGGLGGNWDSYSTSTTASAQWTISGQQAVSGSTSTNLALWKLPVGAAQFGQVVLVNNTGASSGIFLRTTSVSGAFASGYLARHNGTNIAIISFAADGSTTTSLANVAHTRVAGQTMRFTATGSTLTVFIDGAQVLQTTDPSNTWTSGTVALRSATTANVTFDSFYGGDLADVASAPTTGAGTGTTTAIAGGTGGTGGGTTTPTPDPGTVVETVNQSPANGIPAYKGLVHMPSGRLLHRGKLLHRLHADFFGPSGTYTPPAWLTTSGTATLVGPDSSLGRLELTTAATIGATAGLAVTPQLLSSNHRAIRIDVEAMSFSAASPAVEWRLGASDGATAGGGAIQITGSSAVALHTGGENKRTLGVFSHLGANADQRRQTSVLILPADKEVFLLEDDEVLSWRDGTSTWVDGLVTAGLSIKATTATAVTLRLASMTVSTYA